MFYSRSAFMMFAGRECEGDWRDVLRPAEPVSSLHLCLEPGGRVQHNSTTTTLHHRLSGVTVSGVQ